MNSIYSNKLDIYHSNGAINNSVGNYTVVLTDFTNTDIVNMKLNVLFDNVTLSFTRPLWQYANNLFAVNFLWSYDLSTSRIPGMTVGG